MITLLQFLSFIILTLSFISCGGKNAGQIALTEKSPQHFVERSR